MGARTRVRQLLSRMLAERTVEPVEDPFDGTRTVTVGDAVYTMRSDPNDQYLKAIRGEWEPDLAPLFAAVVKPGGIAFDIGANLGFTAILIRQRASRVIAYEISPTTFEHLEQNVERSGHDGIEIVRAGLGAEAGAVELTVNPKNLAGTFIAPRDTADRRYHTNEQAEIRTLDAEVARLGLDAVDFMKIDVEGFESFVLKGGAKTIARFRPVVVMEMNHWCLNAFQRIALPDFLDFVLAMFPLAYAIQGNEYLDLNDPDRRYAAMHKNIVDNSFMNLVVAFEPEQLAAFYRDFTAL